MLSLGRNPGEYIVIGDNIVIQVVEIDKTLRLAIDAPKDVAILRGENYELTHGVPACIEKSRKQSQGKMKRATGK